MSSWRPTPSLEGLGFGLGKKNPSAVPLQPPGKRPRITPTPPPAPAPANHRSRSPSQSATATTSTAGDQAPVAHQPATSTTDHSITDHASQPRISPQPTTQPTAEMEQQPIASNQATTPATAPTTQHTAPTPSAAPPANSAPPPSSTATATTTVQQPRPSPSKTPLFFSEPNDDDGYISSDLSDAAEDVDQLASDSETTNPAPVSAAPPVASTSRVVNSTAPSSSRASANHYAPTNTGSAPKKVKRARPSAGSSFNGSIPPLPHYTVVRSAKNSDTNPHRIIINPGVTDGSRSRWATNTTPGQVVAGKLNWHELQGIDVGKHKAWRFGLGKQLADELGLNSSSPGGKPPHWVLDNWPDNYQFTVHHTSGKTNGVDRLDAYLFGSSATVKFRTVNEFTPHLVWLLTHGPNDNITCKCKYCAKKTQTEVNAALGFETYRAPSVKRESSVAGSSVGGGGGHGSSRPAKKTKLSNYSDDDEDLNTGFIADKTRRGRELVKEKPKKPKKDAAPTYSGSYVNKDRDVDLSDGALYRVGELVWVELHSPFVDLESGTQDRITHWIAVVSERNITSISTKKGSSQSLKPGVAPLLENRQTFSYRCSLLAVEGEITRTEQHVQAWLARPPPNEVFEGDRITAQEGVKFAWDGKQCRRPRLEEMKGLQEAVTVFALASQIAAHIAGSFCLVDRYKITADHLLTTSNLTKEERLRRDQTLECYHYQSLWWGGERIWSGELVRLVPNATNFPPSLLPQSPGAADRSLFLQVAAIYKERKTDQAKLAGRLYELRDLKGVTEIQGDEGGSALSKIEGIAASKDKGKSTSPSPSIVDPSLPSPPPGFEFRSLNRGGSSSVVTAEYVAGRYYALPQQWRTREEVDKILGTMPPKAEIDDGTYLSEEWRAMSLAGLTWSMLVYMTCSTWTVDRHTAITEAELTSQKEMFEWFQSREDSTPDSGSRSPADAEASAAAMDLSA